MNIKSLIFVLLLSCCVTQIAVSSEINLTDIAVYANATVYNDPDLDSVSLVEFPFTLNRNNFEFYMPDSTGTNYYARIFAHVELLDVSGFPIDSTNTLFTVAAKSADDAKSNNLRLFNKLSLYVKPGIYSARVTIIDVVSKKKGEFYIDKITVEKSSKENSVNISNLSSAYNADYVGSDTTRVNPLINKNGYNLLMNPVSVFSDTDKSLFLYGEIYNLEYTENSRTKYQLIINALDKDKNIYQMFGSRLSKKPGSSAVFVETIDIAGWNKGIYSIEVIVFDLSTKKADTAYLPISIISPKEVLLAAQEISKYDDPYNNLTLKQKLQLITYLLTNDEQRVLNSLGDRGKENYLKAVWAEHDPTPSKDKNEFREEIIRRYLYANKNYSTNEKLTNGWLTDRGRIFMEYGMWEERDDKEAPSSGNPFVIWYYHSKEGTGSIFVFEDYYGDDDYRLVHSDVTGEVYDKQWADWILSGFMDLFEK